MAYEQYSKFAQFLIVNGIAKSYRFPHIVDWGTRSGATFSPAQRAAEAALDILGEYEHGSADPAYRSMKKFKRSRQIEIIEEAFEDLILTLNSIKGD